MMTAVGGRLRLDVLVPGPPVPRSRPRVTRKGGVYTSPRSNEYVKRVACYAAAATHRCRWPMGYKGEVAVGIVVTRAFRAGDIDNFAKAVLDGLTMAGVWVDDRQVTGLSVVIVDPPRKPGAGVEPSTDIKVAPCA